MYEIFFQNQNFASDEENKSNINGYKFYLLLNECLINKSNNFDINQLIDNDKVNVIKIKSQLIGSCCFINYMLYKNVPKSYTNILFETWYQ